MAHPAGDIKMDGPFIDATAGMTVNFELTVEWPSM